MFQMTAFSIETGRQTTPPLIHGVVDNKQTITHLSNVTVWRNFILIYSRVLVYST